ncbi:MAG: hypothetical protein ABI559_13135 [Chloroflexota bacterium]
MNELDRFAVTVRLAAAEAEGARRAQAAREEARLRHRPAHWLDRVVVLVVALMLATPIVFLVLHAI